MTPDFSLAENRAAVRDACEKTIRLAYQRGSSATCVQHSQDVIDDAKIMLSAIDTVDSILRDAPSVHQRKCRDCGKTHWHADNRTPYVLCPECKSQDTRKVTA